MLKILFLTDQAISSGTGGALGAKKVLLCLNHYKEALVADYEVISRDNFPSEYNFQIHKSKLKDILSRILLKPNFLAIELKRNYKRIKEYNPDVVLLHNSRFGFVAKKMRKMLPNCTIVTFFENIEADYCKFAVNKLAYPLEHAIVKKEEGKAIKFSNLFVFLSERDRDRAIQLYCAERKLGSNFIFPVTMSKSADSLMLVGNKPTLIMLGTLSYWPNEESVLYFVKEILPKIDRSKFDIVVAGRNPSEHLTKVCQENGICLHNGFDKLSSVCPKSSCLLAPLQTGAGMKTKVAEGLSYGLFIIGSQECFIGYEAVEGRGYVRKATAPEDYAKFINEFYDVYTTGGADELSSTNRKLFDSLYNTDSYVDKFYEFITGKDKARDNK